MRAARLNGLQRGATGRVAAPNIAGHLKARGEIRNVDRAGAPRGRPPHGAGRPHGGSTSWMPPASPHQIHNENRRCPRHRLARR